MIGRTEERRLLRAAAEETEAQFVAVYGRRRVGKTYLVRETLGPTSPSPTSARSDTSRSANSIRSNTEPQFMM